MQIITMYLRATSVKATLVDEWNQTVNVLPALTRGLRVELVLKLLDENGEALKPERLDYASWDFAVANDWDTTTTPQLRVTKGITVRDNEVHVPLTETNTEELIAALGKNEQAQFGCELAGFTTGETHPEFLIPFDIIVRHRRADAGPVRPCGILKLGTASCSSPVFVTAAGDAAGRVSVVPTSTVERTPLRPGMRGIGSLHS